LIAGSAIIASVATFGALVPQAGAAITAQTPLQITAVGSDTTQGVMRAILAGTTTTNVNYTNVDAYITSNVVVPADDFCDGGVTFSPTAPSPATANAQVAPAGSGAGRTLLNSYAAGTLKTVADNSKACVDIARSSSYSATSPAAGSGEYYAYALDAVSWATTSQNAPSSLTPQQLAGIYKCTYTDWSEVGGTAGAIQRYTPPSTSGTRDFFYDEVLGAGDSTINKGVTLPVTANCPAIKIIEENTANLVDKADYNKAIMPYSGGMWSYQAANSTNPTIDKRGRTGSGVKARIGGLNRSEFALTSAGDTKIKNANIVAWNTGDGAWQLNTPGLTYVSGNASDPGGYVVDESYAKNRGAFATTGNFTASKVFPGIRFIFNVLDTRIGATSLAAARAVVGFDNVASGSGYRSPLCNGDLEGTILSAGFAALPSSVGGNDNLAASTCRKWTI
jgi:ABC-type phosphate transport system substrate-binding protein